MDKISENELFDEIITILMAALSIAGVKDNAMQDALQAYEDAIDNMNDDEEYDYKALCKVIMNLKETHRELFK